MIMLNSHLQRGIQMAVQNVPEAEAEAESESESEALCVMSSFAG